MEVAGTPAGLEISKRPQSTKIKQTNTTARVMQHAAEIATRQVSRVMAESLRRLADADLTQADASQPRRSFMVSSVNCE
jgi:hypothetical protein